MRREWSFCVLALLLSLVVSCQVASAGTDLCNVAAHMPTTGSPGYAATMGPDMAVNEVVGTAYGGAYVAATSIPAIETWWKVDLGMARNVDSLTIYTQSNNTEERIDGAWLRAYDVNDQLIGTHTILDGYNDVNIWGKDWDNGGAGWSGVRYFLVGGADGHGPDGGSEGHPASGLGISEFIAYSQVETYPGYIGGVTATASNEYSNGTYLGIQDDHLVNNSGMTDQTAAVVGNPDALHLLQNSTYWCTGAMEEGETPSIEFDLGDDYDLARMLIWNMNQGLTNLTRGLKDVVIETSLDGGEWTELTDLNGEEPGNYTIGISTATEANPDTPYTGDVNLIGITADHVRITALSSHGSAINWGLGEVRFYAVPEPSTLGLLILGLLTLISCRRQTNG